jgi:hypothetical protein
MDLSSLIAHALNSNLYITALANIDYMNLENNIKPYNTEVKGQSTG